MKSNLRVLGKSPRFSSSSRPRIALIEKDNDLLETGSKGVGDTAGERRAGKGSKIDTAERHLIHSIIQVSCYF